MPASMENYNAEFKPPTPPRSKISQADLDPKKPWGGWNLVDQQIALIKGWEYDPMEEGWWRTKREKECNQWVFGGLHWSADDREALELLEEISGGIDLSRIETGGWGIILKDHNLSSVGRTLAQAICHAYVAFKESTQRKPE